MLEDYLVECSKPCRAGGSAVSFQQREIAGGVCPAYPSHELASARGGHGDCVAIRDYVIVGNEVTTCRNEKSRAGTSEPFPRDSRLAFSSQHTLNALHPLELDPVGFDGRYDAALAAPFLGPAHNGTMLVEAPDHAGFHRFRVVGFFGRGPEREGGYECAENNGHDDDAVDVRGHG